MAQINQKEFEQFVEKLLGNARSERSNEQESMTSFAEGFAGYLHNFGMEEENANDGISGLLTTMMDIVNRYKAQERACANHRPFESMQEFLDAQKHHGLHLRLCTLPRMEYMYMPVCVFDDGVLVMMQMPDNSTSNVRVDFEDLLNDFVFQDGTPCGCLK